MLAFTEVVTILRRALAPPAPDGRSAESWAPLAPDPRRAAVARGETAVLDTAAGALFETSATFTLWGDDVAPGDRIVWRGQSWAVRAVAPATLNPPSTTATAVRTEG